MMIANVFYGGNYENITKEEKQTDTRLQNLNN